MEGAPIQIYGDGKLVRDLLFVEDLIDAFELAIQNIQRTAGQAFNIGGGAQNAVSLLELLELIRRLRIEPCRVKFSEWRHADQRYYVSDTRKFQSISKWMPRIRVPRGLELLFRWLSGRADAESPGVLPSEVPRPVMPSAVATRN
jgi:CDP-paratose 2-epimerase